MSWVPNMFGGEDKPPPPPNASAGNGGGGGANGGADESRFRKEPIPLVEVDEDSKFSVNPEAREILEGLSRFRRPRARAPVADLCPSRPPPYPFARAGAASSAS